MSGPGTILVVEDNPITRKMLCVALEIEGYDVVNAGDGKAALLLAAARRPDLLVLDFVLPDMDGVQLLAEIRALLQAPEVPAVIVTGMVSRLEELRAQTGGFTHFLPKPVEPSRLLEVVRAQLAPAGARKGGQRILVVDDEALNLKLASFRLKRAGYDVETAAGGAEALVLAKRSPPDAILSDVMMPSMDGFSFCREARRDPALRNVPIILVSSAYVDEPDRDLARQMGANGLVLRTADLRDVMVALKEGLRGRAATPSAASDESVMALHRDRLQVQLERQTAHTETLLRQAAIQASALSIIRGLSDVLARPRHVPEILGDVLMHCLDAAGLSTGLLYMAESGGEHRLQAQFGVPADRKSDAEAFFGHPEFLRRVVAGGEPVALSAEAKGADPESLDLLARLGYPSVLILPFVVLGETFGELVLASDSHDLTEPAWDGFARTLALQFGQTVALGQSLKRLAASESRYRALMEHANDAIFVLDPQGHVLEANRSAATLLGLPRERMVGQHASTFDPPSASPHRSQFQQLLSEGGGRIDNVVLQRGDGALVEVEFSMSLSEVDGETSVLSIGRDVTQRNRDAATLREARQRLDHVVSSSPAVLYSLKPCGRTFEPWWMSGNVERMLGYGPDELTDQGWWISNLHPDDRDQVLNEIDTLFEADFLAHEYRFRHKDGGYRWLASEMRLLRDAAGAPREAIGSWSDVTARKQAERQMQESEEKYRLLFDSNPHSMWVYDKETLRFLAVNDAALHHYGYSRDEMLALSVLDIRPPEDVAAFEKEIAEHNAQGSEGYQSIRAFRHLKKDGTVMEVDLAANPIVFAGRAAWLVLATDVTEKRTLEAQLLQAQKMEAVGQLAGGVAHDFNNLLGVISGYSELLVRELPTQSRERSRADEIIRAAARAAALTRQLLAVSRRQVLQPKVLDLNSVVADVEKMVRRVISEDIQIVTKSTAGLGRVRADAGQIEQVLMNLVINARDAMPAGGRLVIETGNVDLDESYVRTHPDAHPGRHVMLAVSDSGHGMDARTISRIFEPFFTTKDDGKGTGLGLATVYGIVRQSGGTVTVYSEPGHGTAFKVYLPRVEEAIEEDAPVLYEEPPRGTETVLLVEDSESLRVLISEMLREGGYTVLEADAPDEALARIQSTPGGIDLVLTDMVMPRMSGQELVRRIAVLKPETRVVFMSGYTDQALRGDGTLDPTVLFLQKPFTMDALLKTVRRALDTSPQLASPIEA
jgi:two-component system cell cycle sensor histidine kinase/response regulator CckA